MERNVAARERLGPHAARAAHELVRRLRRQVAARLELAGLFGSRARGDARPDSDVDLLLLWDALPPDREPQATHAEEIAEAVARASGIPLSVWSVSRADLRRGRRTPMLVDALDDALPLWPERARVPRVAFTPADAVFCAGCLLERVSEGSREVAHALARGEVRGASARARDDVLRLCTAVLLLEGITRPRGAAAVRALRAVWPAIAGDPALAWAERGSAAAGEPFPPPSWRAVARLMETLRERVAEGAGLASPAGARVARPTGRILRTAP